MKDRGREDDAIDKFLTRFGDDAVMLSEDPSMYESKEVWADENLSAIFGSYEATTNSEGRSFRLYEMNDQVVAVEEDYSSIRVFADESFPDYRVPNVSDYLGDQIGERVPVEVTETKKFSDIDEENIVVTIEELVDGVANRGLWKSEQKMDLNH